MTISNLSLLLTMKQAIFVTERAILLYVRSVLVDCSVLCHIQRAVQSETLFLILCFHEWVELNYCMQK